MIDHDAGQLDRTLDSACESRADDLISIRIDSEHAWDVPRLHGGEPLTFRRERDPDSLSLFYGGQRVASVPGEFAASLIPEIDSAESTYSATCVSSLPDESTDGGIVLTVKVHKHSNDDRSTAAMMADDAKAAGRSFLLTAAKCACVLLVALIGTVAVALIAPKHSQQQTRQSSPDANSVFASGGFHDWSQLSDAERLQVATEARKQFGGHLTARQYVSVVDEAYLSGESSLVRSTVSTLMSSAAKINSVRD